MADEILKWNPHTQITKGNYSKAAELARKLKTAQKLISDEMKQAVSTAHQAHKAIKQVMDKQLLTYKAVEGVLKDKFIDFHQKNKQLKIDNVVFVDTLEPVVEDASKVPDKYKTTIPDMAKIKAEVKRDGSLFQCPGIKLVASTSVRFYADKD